MKRAYYERPAKAQKGRKCHKCVWRHGSEEYLCDFATLAAPMTRGGVPPEKCRHFVRTQPPALKDKECGENLSYITDIGVADVRYTLLLV